MMNLLNLTSSSINSQSKDTVMGKTFKKNDYRTQKYIKFVPKKKLKNKGKLKFTENDAANFNNTGNHDFESNE